MQHVEDADIAIGLDGLKPADTYLSIEKIIQAAKKLVLRQSFQVMAFFLKVPIFSRLRRKKYCLLCGTNGRANFRIWFKASCSWNWLLLQMYQ